MIIYKTTNLINGKIYIGKDCNEHPWYLGSGIILKKAIKKYGKKNFIKETIEECDCNNLDEREVYWIKKLQSRNPSIGYNILAGGEWPGKGSNHYGFGKHLSEDTKKKLSQSLTGCIGPWKGKVLSKKHRKNISKGGKGKVGTWKGKRLSREHVENIRKSLIGKKHSKASKEKMSQSKKQYWSLIDPLNRKMSNESKAKMSASRKGRLGTCHSEAAKKKIGESSKKRNAVASLQKYWETKKLLSTAI